MNGTGTDLALRVATEAGYSQTQYELIRNVAAKDCSPDEVAQLLITAQRTGLDPLAKQIYMISRWNAQAKRNVATPQTSIDGYRLVADRTNRYAPGKEAFYVYDESGGLFSATAYVKKLVAGTWHEVSATAFWDEYVQTTREGKPTSMWAKMPRLMLGKCAESLALRKAFPAELSGLYTAEEMAQADSTVVDVQPVALSVREDAELVAAREEYNALARRAVAAGITGISPLKRSDDLAMIGDKKLALRTRVMHFVHELGADTLSGEENIQFPSPYLDEVEAWLDTLDEMQEIIKAGADVEQELEGVTLL